MAGGTEKNSNMNAYLSMRAWLYAGYSSLR